MNECVSRCDACGAHVLDRDLQVSSKVRSCSRIGAEMRRDHRCSVAHGLLHFVRKLVTAQQGKAGDDPADDGGAKACAEVDERSAAYEAGAFTQHSSERNPGVGRGHYRADFDDLNQPDTLWMLGGQAREHATYGIDVWHQSVDAPHGDADVAPGGSDAIVDIVLDAQCVGIRWRRALHRPTRVDETDTELGTLGRGAHKRAPARAAPASTPVVPFVLGWGAKKTRVRRQAVRMTARAFDD